MSHDEPQSSEVKLLLERGLGAEPPVRVTRDEILAGGKRRLRRQRATAIGGVALAAAAVLTVVSVTTSGWFASPPVGPATHTTAHVPAKKLSPRDRLAETLRTAPIEWPAEITARTGDPGPLWNDFRYGYLPSTDTTGYEANIRLDTPTGYRWLTIDVFSVPAGEHAPQCIGAQSGQPLPGCTRSELPGGGEIRVDVERPAERNYPVIALITAVRPDHTRVEVLETSSQAPNGRPDQLLATTELVELARLPGFSLG